MISNFSAQTVPKFAASRRDASLSPVDFDTSYGSLINTFSKYRMVYGAHGWGSDSNLCPNSNHLGENSLKARGKCGLVLPMTLRFLYFLLQFLSFECRF